MSHGTMAPIAGLEGGVALLVLLSALLHASWNAIVKVTGDRLLALATVMGTASLVGVVAISVAELPPRASWRWLGLSVCLHPAYHVFLLLAYRHGDLGHVYPIARGSAPLIVAGLSAAVIGEVPGLFPTAALVLVSLGIASLAVTTGPRSGARPVGFALVTGLLIGSYTFVDGQGARSAEAPLDYIAWQFFLSGLPLVGAALWLRRGRVRRFARDHGARALLGGAVACLGYAIVVWALSRGTMAYVAALRETGVIFAALIGTLLLGEPFGRRRIGAAAVVATGAVILSISH